MCLVLVVFRQRVLTFLLRDVLITFDLTVLILCLDSKTLKVKIRLYFYLHFADIAHVYKVYLLINRLDKFKINQKVLDDYKDNLTGLGNTSLTNIYDSSLLCIYL